MPLNNRVLTVAIGLPSGTVTLTQSLTLRVKIRKAALQVQNSATIEIMGMTTSLRLQLLSQFTAWRARQVASGQTPQSFIPVTIAAGYQSTASSSNNTNGSTSNSNTSQSATIFVGYITLVEPSSPPPNIGVRIQAFTRQIDKTQFLTQAAPTSATFKQLVAFAAKQMGLANNYYCNTSIDNKVFYNGFRTIYTVGGLLIGIQELQYTNVAAFIDDDRLIVKDRNAILNSSAVVPLDEFIGTPLWNEWGVEWSTLMNTNIKLASAAALTSSMNPGVNGTYVITELEYDLSSRDGPFYVKAMGSPPA
jgi:hypothetical protein